MKEVVGGIGVAAVEEASSRTTRRRCRWWHHGTVSLEGQSPGRTVEIVER